MHGLNANFMLLGFVSITACRAYCRDAHFNMYKATTRIHILTLSSLLLRKGKPET